MLARERRKAGQARVGDHIGGGIERFDGDAFGGCPGQIGAFDLLGGHFLPVIMRRFGHHKSPADRISGLHGMASMFGAGTLLALGG
jgi:hypothetical protein